MLHCEMYHFQVTWLGHTSTSHVHRYTDHVGCVLVPVAVGRGCLTWIPGSRHSCHAHLDRHSTNLGAGESIQTLTLLGGTRYIAWCLGGGGLSRRMPTEPMAFLGMPGVSELRSCVQTHLTRSLMPYSPVGWGLPQIPDNSNMGNIMSEKCSRYKKKCQLHLKSYEKHESLVDWGFRIHRLHLYREVRLPQRLSCI